MSSLTYKNVNILFYSLLMNKPLGIDSSYLLRRKNKVTDKNHTFTCSSFRGVTNLPIFARTLQFCIEHDVEECHDMLI